MRASKDLAGVRKARDRIAVVAFLFVAIVCGIVLAADVRTEILDSVRAYVRGEGLWSKGQKAAVYHLTRYAASHREEDFELYRWAIDVPLGDRQARVELEKPEPDDEVVREGFLRGRNDPDDISGLASLFRRFRHVSYMERAIDIWTQADDLIARLRDLAEQLRAEILAEQPDGDRVREIVDEVARIDARLTPLEDAFSANVSDGARWARTCLTAAMYAGSALLLVIGVLLSRRMLLAARNEWEQSEQAAREAEARRRAEETLRETRRFVERVADATPHILYLYDLRERRLLYVNRQVTRVLGYGTALPKRTGLEFLRALVHPEDLPQLPKEVDAFLAGVGEGQVVETEIRIKSISGDWRWMHSRTIVFARDPDGSPRQVLGTAQDVTERRRADEHVREHEAALAHVLHVSTLGEMATGLAHELNQPLAAIVSFARGSARRLRAGVASADELLPVVDQISAEALRAGEFIRHLRALVIREQPVREPLDLNDLVQGLVRLAAPEARRRAVAIHLELSPGSVTVAADRIQIEQVVLNLLHNGFDAMDRTPLADRAITIRTALEDDAASIAVSDHGIGLAPDVQTRVFEQFFTTKGGGMGMGLAISRSIVEAHGGHLWATSNKPRGATFWVRLPAELARSRAAADDGASGDRPRTGRGARSRVA